MKRINIYIGLVCLFGVVLASEGIAQEKEFETFEYSQGDTTYVMKKYFLLIYERGNNRTHDKAEAAKIQEGHLAHLERLAREEKICVAGPMESDGKDRGLIIYSVYSMEEAEELSKKDPAVEAGRLNYRIVPFWAAKGSRLF